MFRPHVVILGAGFGGVYVGKKLSKHVKNGDMDVTIVNRTNNFLFTPLLHEVATGALEPGAIAEPLREIFVGSNTRILQGEVSSINLEQHKVMVSINTKSTVLNYDYLLIATGAETNYYGIPGASEFALPLKSLSNAALIRDRIIDVFEQAVTISLVEERKKLLSFVVVGGGATGVEVAAELSNLIGGLIKRYYGRVHCREEDLRHCELKEVSLTIVHSGDDILEQFASNLRKAALNRLIKKGVKVLVKTKVTSITSDGVEISSGERIPASVIIWSAGVKAVTPKFEGIGPTLSGGRIALDNFFRILGNDRVFAMGDVAAYVNNDSTRPLPQLAQVAERQAKIVAMNIVASIQKKPLKDFYYKSRGSMISVGQWFAVGQVFNMNIAGRVAWWIWRTVYLFKFASWKKRLRIAFEWSLELFFPRDITKLS